MIRSFIAARFADFSALAAAACLSVVVAACSDVPTQPTPATPRGPARTLTTNGSVLTVTPTSFDYGSVIVGESSASQTFVVANTGIDLLYLTDIAVTGPNAGDFQVGERPAPGCSFGGEWGWPAGMPCYIGLQFVPGGIGPRTATLTIKSAVGTVLVQLTGTGLATPAVADLSVGMTAAMQGKSITYSIVVRNSGPSEATTVDVGDMLPAGTTFASVNAPSDFKCLTPAVGATGPVKCSAAALPAAASRTIQLVVKLGGATKGVVSNTAAVVSAAKDPDTSNNSATATVNVGRK